MTTTVLWAALVSTFVAATAQAGPLSWTELDAAGAVKAGQVVDETLRVDGTSGSAVKIELLQIEAPAIESLQWNLHGEVRYDGIEGEAYLELNNVLPSGTFFTRTLGVDGPLKKLSGTSSWRPFVLPFDATGAAPPEKLILSVFLPNGGRVEIGPMQLVDGPFDTTGGAWLSGAQAGTLFGILGALFGCLAGALGVMTTRAPRGLVMTVLYALMAGSAVTTIAGVIANVMGQPRHIWIPALLGGLFAFGLLLGLRGVVTRRIQERELRRMRSMDVAETTG